MGGLLPRWESQFSLPLNRGSNGRGFFFRGAGASARDMFDRAYLLVPGRVRDVGRTIRIMARITTTVIVVIVGDALSRDG